MGRVSGWGWVVSSSAACSAMYCSYSGRYSSFSFIATSRKASKRRVLETTWRSSACSSIVRQWWSILKMCPRTYEKNGVGCWRASWRYSSVASHSVSGFPENSAGLWRTPSADMTPSQEVYSRQRSTSSFDWMFPFAKTGTATASLTLLMCSQFASPVSAPFCSRKRPWTPSKETPALSIIFAYLTVFSMSSKIRILHVIGLPTSSTAVLTEVI